MSDDGKISWVICIILLGIVSYYDNHKADQKAEQQYQKGREDALDDLCVAAKRQLDAENWETVRHIAGCGY